MCWKLLEACSRTPPAALIDFAGAAGAQHVQNRAAEPDTSAAAIRRGLSVCSFRAGVKERTHPWGSAVCLAVCFLMG